MAAGHCKTRPMSRPGIATRSCRSSQLAARGAENAVAGIGAFQQFDFETQAQRILPAMLGAISALAERQS